jgi:ATP-binding protein involved in chromosome partitioning
MAITSAQVLDALRNIQEPDLKQDIVSLNMVRDVVVNGERVVLKLMLKTHGDATGADLKSAAEKAIIGAGAREVLVTLGADVKRAATANGPQPHNHGPGPAPRTTQADRMQGVKAVIAVGAGKGGVGKSTVATNLAIALSKLGAKVGLLDADIYGPSVPIMLGLGQARPALDANEKIVPLQRYGLKVMSMGFMLEEGQAVVWRGPMLGKALQQFIEDVDWGELDYVVVDMPPGTGDVQLSLAQHLPVAGAVVVTTPQDVAFADVRRAIDQLQKTRIDILGLVENMAGFVCGQCGAEHAIFGESRIEKHAEANNLEVLGRLPLDNVTAIAADQGEPITVAAPDSDAARRYLEIARQVARKVAIITHERTANQSKFQGFFGSVPRPN